MNKKIILFLIITVVTLLPKIVLANDRTFYEAEYIDGIYMNKLTPDRKTIYYQKARVFRDSYTNEYAYCVEPFAIFNGNNNYNENQTPYNLSNEQINNISLIAHYGYGYKNHTEIKWYAITQLMIWQIAEPNGTYYFTDSLNGNKIYPYNNEINEINELINEYKRNISFEKTNYELVENEELVLTDYNNVLNKYKTSSPYASINNNTLNITNLPTGTTKINLIYQDNYYNKPLLFYQSYNSQNLVENGNLSNKETYITINVQKTSITINKLDKDNNSKDNSGEGKLSGAIYQLYDKNMKELVKLEIDNNTASINNLSYGTYYLKEITPGTGYTLDENVYEININKDTPQIILDLYNEVIKAKLIINKEYEIDNTTEKEKDITFEIYNNKNELVYTLITDELGHAETILPYGTYYIKQTTTKEGYMLVEPFSVIVRNDIDITYDLINYKIPDTSTTIFKYIVSILKRFIWISLNIL